MHTIFPILVLVLGGVAGVEDEHSPFEKALRGAERFLEAGEPEAAWPQIQRALERDAASPRAWALRVRWGEAVGDADDRIFSLHRQYRLMVLQEAGRAELRALRDVLMAEDPIAGEVLDMKREFVADLKKVATSYEADGRRHSAIRVHKEILALDPGRVESEEAIERIAAFPDPSLAAEAKPKDLLEGISEEWIREHDAAHDTWKTRARLVRENYTTMTDGGYAALVRAAEAMEQMNAFYRMFFNYGTEEDGRSVSRIELRIFKNRDEYLELGSGPPADWSGGQFTGGAVETYIGDGGFEAMTGTLFHEAAHQFVSLATRAVGWLNEGLASFFEGCRILGNGTVLMNLPANHRLFPLVDRMDKGWMASAEDGLDPEDPTQTPETAPTFRIVLENRYRWGPPWYAPTWGVVFFLYNYQDPWDGRFVYRRAFREFIDKSGGRSGKGAVKNFEEVVLENPTPPIDRKSRPDDMEEVDLPTTVEELDDVWKTWLTRLRDEQSGKLEVERPFLRWAQFALQAGDLDVAQEHFEKGVVAAPDDVDVLLQFATFLHEERGNPDRATKLLLEAIQSLEGEEVVQEDRLDDAERLLRKTDPKRRTLARVHEKIAERAVEIVTRYREANRPMMVMDLSWRLGTDLKIAGLFEEYELALRESGKSIQIWKLAYNEKDLDGWNVVGDSAFKASAETMVVDRGTFSPGQFDFQVLTLDTVTSGDFSIDLEVDARRGEASFCGIVVGRKDASTFHSFILFPGQPRAGAADTGFVDLTSHYGADSYKTWRHIPVDTSVEPGQTLVAVWHRLRLDVTGAEVDLWFDGELLARHAFPSRDVLRGNFGLIMGPGKARYRNVRYLALHPRDPASAIERAVRLEALTDSETGRIGDSWLGVRPPFPTVLHWAQGERLSWAEAGPVPQLLVLWSINQNDMIPMHDWLSGLAEEYEDIGLRIVSIASAVDGDELEFYVAENRFPYAVGLDHREGFGIGKTFETFAIDRYNLPRLLLLDIDGRVAWEGDPGFVIGEGGAAGSESYLDAPLAELIDSRRLYELGRWMKDWRRKGHRALLAGDLATVGPILLASGEFQSGVVPDVDLAQRALRNIRRSLENDRDTAQRLREMGRAPALLPLLAWGPSIGIPFDEKAASKRHAKVISSTAGRDWTSVLRAVKRFSHGRGEYGERLANLMDGVRGESPFAAEVRADLEAALGAGGGPKLEEILANLPHRLPAWLAREFFSW
jgi:Tfp pilus assembly protein PilF